MAAGKQSMVLDMSESRIGDHAGSGRRPLDLSAIRDRVRSEMHAKGHAGINEEEVDEDWERDSRHSHFDHRMCT